MNVILSAVSLILFSGLLFSADNRAENILLHQRNNGGWPKHYDQNHKLTEVEKQTLRSEKKKNDTTFDNEATHTEVSYLAKAFKSTGDKRFEKASLEGIEFMLDAQYNNGGWPQCHPHPKGYSARITFNDGAMIGVISTLRDISRNSKAFPFVNDDLRKRCSKAVSKGVACILKCQIMVKGKRTAWCAQHDEKTLVAQMARSYELSSTSGAESVGVIRFLMEIDEPSPEIIDAVQGGVSWFNEVKLIGIRQIKKEAKGSSNGWDKVVVRDASAPPMWARFYEIGTNRPIFCSRDGVPRKTLAEISFERRNGYSWLGYYAQDLLAKDYSLWQPKWVPKYNILSKSRP